MEEMNILDGKKISGEIRGEISVEVSQFKLCYGISPVLAAVIVGNDPASKIYVNNKQKACEEVGIESRILRLSETVSTGELLRAIDCLNNDSGVHGILVQRPLPNNCNENSVLDAVDPCKDVDSFHPENVGLVSQGRPRFLPCTPFGIRELLLRSGIETGGKNAVIVGRSNIVGKPMGLMLLQQTVGGNATVTIAHSRTKNLAAVVRCADILIAAIGVPKFITADMVGCGAVVIDVGINRLQDGKICGDVDFDNVKEIASAITPVPGGVGPLTVTMLLRNTLTAAKLIAGKSSTEN
ncbi:MAG: bifunctional 5,10-methylenetetrahydrofolate dehydrogenase/5,10-methenyltetrahydrofolate cyclohydrolase [Planctomycetaceae bacterium]|jgi:methylenetetrahydrofolate dehydrogenase (NADP+)/methenyltetrahydrofolate cyclohydrolase|nr:bifunctional 5,10-methylenetetrahydrofolate dehydrogenase/5,10-methenyltetrahydrofolate cyclohydrolase [Planctomycetaceae bacterium]